MPLPSASYLLLRNGVQNATFTGSKIKTGDTLLISGTASNNGVFLVTQVVDNINDTTGIGAAQSETVNTHGSNITAASPQTITLASAYTKLAVGLHVSGHSSIPSDGIISAVAGDNTSFTLGKSLTGTLPASTSLTFKNRDIYYVLKGRPIATESTDNANAKIKVIRATGDKMVAVGESSSSSSTSNGVSVWSNNATTSYSTQDNGWSQLKIKPCLEGTQPKFIFHFVDEVLRVCDSVFSNTSIVKWYGYIQKDQFNNSLGLTFAEWQDHSNVLRSPETNSAGISISFAHTTHAADTAGAYYNEASDKSRGVARRLRNASDAPLLLDGAIGSATATSFVFDDDEDEHSLDQAYAGEIITIGTNYGTAISEVLFCSNPALGFSDSITYKRGYGGTTAASSYSDDTANILRRGIGWNLGVGNGTADGSWEGLTYEFYQSFIYDGNQESIPVAMGDGNATIAKKTHTQESGKSMRVSIYADSAYNARISGGRIYIREANTDNDLVLLADIDIVKGVRTSLDGDHVAWTPNDANGTKGFYVLGDATGNSSKENIDTYTTINGFSPDVKYLSIGGIGEGYKTSVVENRRVFIANVKVLGASGELEVFGDRIMYSEINKFDTFLPHNFIDVSKGDYGVYTALLSYGDRLIAFKNNLIHIINIASPSPANWFLEETIKHSGINYPYSATKTEYGVAWVSENGCFLFNGNKTVNLLQNTIAVNESSHKGTVGSDSAFKLTWNQWYRGTTNVKNPMIGYDPVGNLLLIMRSPDNSSGDSNLGWMYNFDTNSWVFHSSLFTNSYQYTNFNVDWNGNLSTGVYNNSASTITFRKYIPIKQASSAQNFFTKDIDFGQPGLIKKIYKVMITYKSTGELQNPLQYAINGTQSFGNFASTITPQGNTGGDASWLESTGSSGEDWDIGVFTPSSPISCQSIQFEFDLNNSTKFELNDMTIEYRIIRQKNVT